MGKRGGGTICNTPVKYGWNRSWWQKQKSDSTKGNSFLAFVAVSLTGIQCQLFKWPHFSWSSTQLGHLWFIIAPYIPFKTLWSF